jgi:Cu-Zn family superoxide dismutase
MEKRLNRVARLFVVPMSFFASALLMGAIGCDKDKDKTATDTGHPATNAVVTPAAADAGKTAVAVIVPAKAATTQPSNQTVAGTVTFTPDKDGIKVVADLTGLSPGKHGIHIHDKADLSAPDLTSAGGHWDPEGHKQHGGPASDADKRHAGDLGNLEADATGKAHYEITITGVSIGGKDDIVGHSVIIHAKEDDLKSNPSGNSGGRVAGGVIEAKASK